MRPEVGSYLDEVRAHLHLDPRTERRVINELYTHFQEKVGDLQYQGMEEEEATKAALGSFGDARYIARLMYEAHSRGSWMDALISCQPHFMLAALFATHIWRYPLLLAGAFAAIAIIAMMGWRNGSPNWLYSWMGYALLPLLILSYVSMDPVAQTVAFLLRGHGTPASLWHLAGLAVLYAFTFWLIASTAVRVARRDWILLSLMLLPLPGDRNLGSHRHPQRRIPCERPSEPRDPVQQVGFGDGILLCRARRDHRPLCPHSAARVEGDCSDCSWDLRKRPCVPLILGQPWSFPTRRGLGMPLPFSHDTPAAAGIARPGSSAERSPSVLSCFPSGCIIPREADAGAPAAASES